MDDGEDVAVADEARERAREARRARFRDDATARGSSAEAAAKRAVHTGDGERAEEGVAYGRVREPRLEQRHERGRGEAIEAREARAVGEADAGERHLGRREVRPHDAGPGRRRAEAELDRPEVLQEQLGSVVVALAAHVADDLREGGGGVGREHEPCGGELADAGRLRDEHAPGRERLAQQRGGGERRLGRRLAAIHGARHRQRRERRRLVDVEATLPAGAGAARVEPRLVADDGTRDVADPGGGDLRGQAVDVSERERRVAVALQEEVAGPDVRDEGAPAHDVGVEAIAGPEQRERGVGDGDLLVRRRHEGEGGVAREHDPARPEVDRQRGAARMIEPGHLECCRKAGGQGRLRRVRGRRARGGDRQGGRDGDDE